MRRQVPLNEEFGSRPNSGTLVAAPLHGGKRERGCTILEVQVPDEHRAEPARVRAQARTQAVAVGRPPQKNAEGASARIDAGVVLQIAR